MVIDTDTLGIKISHMTPHNVRQTKKVNQDSYSQRPVNYTCLAHSCVLIVTRIFKFTPEEEWVTHLNVFHAAVHPQFYCPVTMVTGCSTWIFISDRNSVACVRYMRSSSANISVIYAWLILPVHCLFCRLRKFLKIF